MVSRKGAKTRKDAIIVYHTNHTYHSSDQFLTEIHNPG